MKIALRITSLITFMLVTVLWWNEYQLDAALFIGVGIWFSLMLVAAELRDVNAHLERSNKIVGFIGRRMKGKGEGDV